MAGQCSRNRCLSRALPARLLDAGGGTGAFAVPLAVDGYDVTLLDASSEWLDHARGNADRASVPLRLVKGKVEDAPGLLEPGFDAILCHTVLLYAEDATACLRGLRSLANEAAILSLLEKNRGASPSGSACKATTGRHDASSRRRSR